MVNNGEKVIEMILKDGSLSGWVFADDGEIELHHCSREDAASKPFIEQVRDKTGVYILYSDDELYVGRSTDLSDRTADHQRKKLFWNRIVTISRKVPMDMTMLVLCEGILIEKARRIPGMKCLNVKGRDTAYEQATQARKATILIDNAILLMNVIGIRFFEEENAKLRRRLLEATRKKTEAIKYLKNIGVVLGENVYYCSNATKHNSFSVDVDKDVADGNKWTLIINNTTEKKLCIAHIPAGKLEGVTVRGDTNKYEVKFHATDLTIRKTNLNLKDFTIQEIRY